MKTHKAIEPFIIVENEEEKFFTIAVGNYAVTTKRFNTLKAARQYIGTKPYDLIFNATLVFYKTLQNLKEDEEKSNKQPISTTD